MGDDEEKKPPVLKWGVVDQLTPDEKPRRFHMPSLWSGLDPVSQQRRAQLIVVGTMVGFLFFAFGLIVLLRG